MTAVNDEQFVEQLAADLCDRARRPARTVYNAESWDRAGRENAGPPEVTKREWWRRHAREVIAAVRHHVEPIGEVRSLRELEALGARAVVRDDLGIVYTRDGRLLGYWLRAGRGGRTPHQDVRLPAVVLDAGHGPAAEPR